jgi:hypothetical protein
MDPFDRRFQDRLGRLDRAAPNGLPPNLGASLTAAQRPAAVDPRLTIGTSGMRPVVASLAAGIMAITAVAVGTWYLTRTAPDPGAVGSKGSAIDWDSGAVHLTADGLRIVTTNHTFTAAGITRVAPPDSFACAETVGDCISIVSDGTTSRTYRTLELSWREAGREMRLTFYLAADDRTWWVSEIRTRDGRPLGHEDWLTWGGLPPYGLPIPGGKLLETPLGSAWTGDLDLVDGVGTHHLSDGLTPTGELHIEGMTLRAF